VKRNVDRGVRADRWWALALVAGIGLAVAMPAAPARAGLPRLGPDIKLPDDKPDKKDDQPNSMTAPLPISETEEKALKRKLGNVTDVIHSAHFSIMCVGEPWITDRVITLLERVYRRFYNYFRYKKVHLKRPKSKLLAVVFERESDYKALMTKLGLDASEPTLGFYYRPDNTLYFFVNVRSDEHMKLLKEVKWLRNRVRDMAKLGRRLRSGSRVELSFRDGTTRTMGRSAFKKYVRTLERQHKRLLRTVNEFLRDSDMSTLAHETTHQLCFNAGLMGQKADLPIWLVEGMAMYFEESYDPKQTNIGVANKGRVRDYRYSRAAGLLLPLETVIQMRTYRSSSAAAAMADYAQFWSLAFFMYKTRPEQMAQYMNTVATYADEEEVPAAKRIGDFKKAFGNDLKLLEREWRTFMRAVEKGKDPTRQDPKTTSSNVRR